MTTTAITFAAVFLSLTKTNDYLFTHFSNSNVVKEIKGFGTSPYAITRAEDFAFLHEASLERDLARTHYSSTNAYVQLPFFEAVTNMAGFAHWYVAGFPDALALERIQREWFTTNASYGCEQLYSSSNLQHIVSGLTRVDDPDADRLKWIRTRGFDQMAGFEGLWWTNGSRRIHYAPNFQSFYGNIKAAEIIQDLKTPYHSNNAKGKEREIVDSETYRFDFDGEGNPYWVKNTDKHDTTEDDSMLDVKKNDRFRIHTERAYLALTRYERDGIPGVPLGHEFNYTCTNPDPTADIAFFNVAIVTNRSDQSPSLEQGYEVVKSFALAEAKMDEAWRTNSVHKKTYWAFPVEVVDQKKDGTVTVKIGIREAASGILRAMGYEELEKSGPILQEMAGGHPDAPPVPPRPISNSASLAYEVRILELTSVIRMQWRSRWFETEEERDREIQ